MGFEQAGIKTAYELDIVNGIDITKADPQDYPATDILAGGPPCVRTSSAAALHRQRTKQTLWPYMLRFIDAHRPPWVVVEQPKGGRDVILAAAQELQQRGYGCAGRVINSRHWLPQRRERWLLVGRMGSDGMALWDHLYPYRERVEGRQQPESAHEESESKELGGWSDQPRGPFDGNCADCLPGGVLARISARKSALIAAGNAVSVPVAQFIGKRIVESSAAMTLPP